MTTWDEAPRALSALSRYAHGRGWIPGTSGNFSAVLQSDPMELAITPSGADKGNLDPSDILRIDAHGTVLLGAGRPSAETPIHLAIVSACGAGAVAHTHSRASTLASRTPESGIFLRGYELLKGLAGVTSHDHVERLPVIENTQDWKQAAIEELLQENRGAHGFLIRRHGLYTWGRDITETRRHLEALEFLLDLFLVGESPEGG